MKVAYLAPYYDGTGYSHAAIEYILALDEVGVTVAPRPVQMTPTKGKVPSKILQLEDNDLQNVDVVIQHNLPNTFVFKNNVKNVGMFAYETNSVPRSCLSNLQIMNHIIVFCNKQKLALEKNGIKSDVVPHAVNIDKFNKQYKREDFNLPKNCLKFYTISENTKRKNLTTLLLSYFSAFTSDDNVALVIKTNDTESLKRLSDNIKKNCNRFTDPTRYPRVILIGGYLHEDKINSIHVSCDVFVSASHGEAWCIPGTDAMGFGNPIIAPNTGAFSDYVKTTNNTGITLDVQEGVVFGIENAPNGYYQAGETWDRVNNVQLAKAMKYLYLDREWQSQEQNDSRRDAVKQFSRENIGRKLKETLSAI